MTYFSNRKKQTKHTHKKTKTKTNQSKDKNRFALLYMFETFCNKMKQYTLYMITTCEEGG